MAIAINVYPNLSPRIIEIQAPTTNASVQEIVNACREWEDSEDGMYYPYLIDAAGKEDLGGGVKVGITATLQNAQIAFEAQSGSDSVGSVTTSDALGKHLIDSTATFITDGILPGDTVFNTTDGSITTVLSVDSETQLTTFGLADGTDNQFAASDNYKIWNKVQCEVSGGNLVAVDNLNATISSFLPTAQTHVVRTSSSSATLQEQADIQFASFNGGVSVDVVNGVAGTAFPTGTERQPVNNFDDALLIANERGFNTFYIVGDAVIDNSNDFSNYTFIGQGENLSTFTLHNDAIFINSTFLEATITGTLDGEAHVQYCVIDGLNFVSGLISNCILNSSTIVLGGSSTAHFINCASGVPGVGTPTIDMGGSGQALAIRNYNGGIRIINKSGTDAVSIDMNSGQVKLGADVTNGTIVMRGVGTLSEDLSSGATIVNQLLNPSSISDAVWDETMTDHTTVGTTGETLNTAKKKANLAANLSA